MSIGELLAATPYFVLMDEDRRIGPALTPGIASVKDCPPPFMDFPTKSPTTDLT